MISVDLTIGFFSRMIFYCQATPYSEKTPVPVVRLSKVNSSQMISLKYHAVSCSIRVAYIN